MADTKISALPASTTPLAGTEVLPIVQSGVTKQVSVANLTAGRAVSAASVTASTGNFVVGTSGQGIDFSATPGTGTSELLADYEEGTFTPTVAGNTTAGVNTYTTQVGRYTKVGNRVNFDIAIIVDTMGTGGNAGAGYATVVGLPFTPAGTTQIAMTIGWIAVVTFTGQLSFYGFGGTTALTIREIAIAGYGSTIPIANVGNGAYISVSGSYSV